MIPAISTRKSSVAPLTGEHNGSGLKLSWTIASSRSRPGICWVRCSGDIIPNSEKLSMVSPELRRRTPPAATPIVAVSSQAYVVEFDQTASTMRATRTWPFISANFTSIVIA